jgi:hypothetical protein
MGGACIAYWGIEKCAHNFGWKARRENTSWNRWDNIKMDLREIGVRGVDCLFLAQVRDWHGNERPGYLKDVQFLDHLSVLLTSQRLICM